MNDKGITGRPAQYEGQGYYGKEGRFTLNDRCITGKKVGSL